MDIPQEVHATYALSNPLPVQFYILDGKHMTGSLFDGVITSISSNFAQITTDKPLEILSNLKLEFTSADSENGMLAGDLYAKTIKVSDSPNTYLLRFTALPEEIAEAIRVLCSPIENNRN